MDDLFIKQSNLQTLTGINKYHYDKLYVVAKDIVIKNEKLGTEINMEDKIKNFKAIIIDGIEFVRKD